MAKKDNQKENVKPVQLNTKGEVRDLDEPTYTREEIQAASSSFGVRPEVLAGALRDADGDRMTRQQVQAAITKFRQKEV